MAEYSTPEERTEMPTDKRMGQIRRQGAMHASHEVVQVMTLLTSFILLSKIMGHLFESFKFLMIHAFAMAGDHEPITIHQIYTGFIGVLYLIAPTIFGFVATIAFVSGFTLMYQTKWNIKEKKIDFKISHLNPINGLKRIFSVYGFVNTGKAILKLSLILPIAYFALKGEAPKMIQLIHTSIPALLEFVGTEMMSLFWKIMYVLIAMAIFDYVWGKYRWLKNNKMTKEEVKDERKAVEGDETTRRRIVAKGLQRIAQRLRSEVPKADVVITNPTHYAVALKYDRDTMRAPTVVAKGKGHMALLIRELAKEAGVPVLERKLLARSLHASVEVGKEIPYELFKAVAEVLAYVYRLKNPWGHRSQART